MSNGIERLKKYLKDFIVLGGIGFGYLIVILVGLFVIKGEEGVLDWLMDWGVNYLIGFGICLTIYFTFGKKSEKRVKELLKQKKMEQIDPHSEE